MKNNRMPRGKWPALIRRAKKWSTACHVMCGEHRSLEACLPLASGALRCVAVSGIMPWRHVMAWIVQATSAPVFIGGDEITPASALWEWGKRYVRSTSPWGNEALNNRGLNDLYVADENIEEASWRNLYIEIEHGAARARGS